MKTSLVLVEREDTVQKSVTACSGLMLNDNYVIVTSNIFFDLIINSAIEELPPGKLHTDVAIFNDVSVNIIEKDGAELFLVRKAKIFSVFVSGNIKNSSKYIFQNWSIDATSNNGDLNKVMSVFFVLTINKTVVVENFKTVLKEWWDGVIKQDVSKGNTIYTRSVPFANRNFINSVSKGIVSNVLGNSSCLIVSDCPCAPGCEGSPVYLYESELLHNDVAVGLVLSSLSWWRGEWIGLTLIADVRPLILEMIDISVLPINTLLRQDNFKVIATTECCLAQIYSGKSWGTAILLNLEKGIFITNSHIVQNGQLILYHNGKHCKADLIYQTPTDEVFDLAVVKSDPYVLKNQLKLRSISVSNRKCMRGDTVYSAGYSLFPKECNASPSLSKGCISQVNPAMIKTTCCVHPGSSGGAILDSDGKLLGIIVCNSRLEHNNTVYPRINMAVPVTAVVEIILDYIKTEDPVILNKLHVRNCKAEFVWKMIEGKL